MRPADDIAAVLTQPIEIGLGQHGLRAVVKPRGCFTKLGFAVDPIRLLSAALGVAENSTKVIE